MLMNNSTDFSSNEYALPYHMWFYQRFHWFLWGCIQVYLLDVSSQGYLGTEHPAICLSQIDHSEIVNNDIVYQMFIHTHAILLLAGEACIRTVLAYAVCVLQSYNLYRFLRIRETVQNVISDTKGNSFRVFPKHPRNNCSITNYTGLNLDIEIISNFWILNVHCIHVKHFKLLRLKRRYFKCLT